MTVTSQEQANSRMQIAGWAALIVVHATGCTIEEMRDAGPGGRSGAGVAALSEEATVNFALMRWAFGSVPSLEEAASLPTTAAPADQAAIDAAAAAIAEDSLDSVTFDRTRGRLKLRSYEREIGPGPDLTNEQALFDAVNGVMDAVGASPEQVLLESSTLRAVGGEFGQEPAAFEVAKTVTIGRRLLGLNVALDYGAASFGMDGEFITMWLQWCRVDYANSVLAVEGIETEEDVMAAAAQSLADHGRELSPNVQVIDVGTYYRARPPADAQSDLWTLHLVGKVALGRSDGVGTGEAGTIPTYAFYLDGGGPITPVGE